MVLQVFCRVFPALMTRHIRPISCIASCPEFSTVPWNCHGSGNTHSCLDQRRSTVEIAVLGARVDSTPRTQAPLQCTRFDDINVPASRHEIGAIRSERRYSTRFAGASRPSCSLSTIHDGDADQQYPVRWEPRILEWIVRPKLSTEDGRAVHRMTGRRAFRCNGSDRYVV